MNKRHIFSIGHSNHSIEDFGKLLQCGKITAIADVRSAPYSRFTPQFNREPLKAALREMGVKYVFLGRELGARSDDPACYERGRVQYARLARTNIFREGIERILAGSSEHRIALMCAEKDPLECHRTLLVSRALVAADSIVDHILADGRIESHTEAMLRLLQVVSMPKGDLFRSQEELILDALARQEERIAYIDPRLGSDASRGAS